MADAASVTNSSVAPGDSVSSRGGKKKPGKRERQEARAVRQGSGNPASASKASAFSAGAHSDPVPQPGKFPIVFQTGAGEPTRDREFALSGDTVCNTLTGLFSKFSSSEKFAEFKANSDLVTSQFETFVKLSFTLGLAQQVVHSHVNMGLPLGDFSPVNSTNVECFSSLRAIISQYGEYSVPALGTRYLFADYSAEVRKLIRLSSEIFNGRGDAACRNHWLPVGANDRSSALLIADKINSLLQREFGLDFRASSELENSVLSGEVPDAWERIKPLLGAEPAEGVADTRDRFDFLFKSYASEGLFFTAFTTPVATGVLSELGIPWSNPGAGALHWGDNAKEVFSNLSDRWQKMVPTFNRFFTMTSVLVNRPVATGSCAQMSSVSTSDGITVVRTAVALSAPEFSLLACFPSSGVFSHASEKLVVLTTPLNVRQRATEFCQLDWK